MRFDKKTNRLIVSAAATLGLVVVVGCGTEPPPAEVIPADGIPELSEPLEALAGTCAYDSTTKLMTLTLADGETVIVSARSLDNVLLINGYANASAQCTNIETSDIKGLTVAETSPSGTTQEKLIVDFISESFHLGASDGSGLTVDLDNNDDGSEDSFALRGSTSADEINMGKDDSGNYLISTNADAFPDITLTNPNIATTFSMSEGNDKFYAAGASADGVFDRGQGANAYDLDLLTVHGGAGNDTILGGSGADSLNGGEGDDTFLGGAAADGADSFDGGAHDQGDVLDYSDRTNDLTVTIAGGGVSGEAGESDDVANTVEIVKGGSGDDDFTGDATNNTFYGNDGADEFYGMAGHDVMYGGAGDDIFYEDNTHGVGPDDFECEAGTDQIQYEYGNDARAAAVVVTMGDSNANDGSALDEDDWDGDGDADRDNVDSTCENILGTNLDDDITGNGLGNEINGLAGNDTLSGGAGNDTFPMGSADDGDDVLIGGDGVDEVDYSSRTAAITVDMVGNADTADADDGDTGAGEADDVYDDVENCLGASGAFVNTLTGNALDNKLEGGSADDVLVGGDGNDELFGAAGNDLLQGGDGDDTLDGGSDAGEGDILQCGAGDGDIGINGDAWWTATPVAGAATDAHTVTIDGVAASSDGDAGDTVATVVTQLIAAGNTAHDSGGAGTAVHLVNPDDTDSFLIVNIGMADPAGTPPTGAAGDAAVTIAAGSTNCEL